MKRNRISLILLSLLVLTSLVGIFSMNSFAQSTDLNYTFRNDNLYNSTNPVYDDDFNVRSHSEYTQIYNATYSFTEDVEGGHPADWVVDEGALDNPIQVLDFGNHDNVLMLNDSSGGDRISATQSFSNVSDASFEFWWAINDIADSWNIVLSVYEDSNEIMAIAINNDDLESFDIAWQDIKTNFIITNIFFHVRFDLNDSANTFDCYVNGILEADDFDFQNHNTNGINSIEFKTSTDDTPISHVDAVGYSWDGYNATYSFNDETDGDRDTVIGFIDGVIDQTNAYVEVQNKFEGHYKVIHAHSDGVGDRVRAYNNFIAQESGVIEWFMSSDDASNQNSVMISTEISFAGENLVSQVYIQNDNVYFAYGNGVGSTIYVNVGVCVDNQWVHISFRYDTLTDTYDGYLDGVLVVDDVNFMNDNVFGANDIDYFTIYSANLNSDFYLDAIGYSWDPYYNIGDNLIHYSIGNNFIPYQEVSETIKEVDRWEFSFSSFQVQYAVGSDVFSDWSAIEFGGRDYVNIDTDPVYNSRRRIKIENNAPFADNTGIVRNFGIDEGIFNITWGVEFTNLGVLNDFETLIYSADNILIAHLYFVNNFLRGTDDGGLYQLYDAITDGEFYELNWYINYYDEISVLRFYIDGVHEDTYYINLIASGEDGIHHITHQRNGGVVDFEGHISYAGVYVNGSSISTEFGYTQLEDILGIGEAYWKFRENNLFSFNAIGNLSFWVSDTFYFPFISTVAQINPLDVYNNSEVFNVWELDDFGAFYQVHEPMLWIQFYDTLETNEISIDGVKLIQTSNEYWIEFTYGNVDIDESYFYVDSSNRLNGVCHYNDSGLEFIQANFDINNVLNENRSLRFRSKFSGQYGFFSLSYIDLTSSTIDLPISMASHNIILPQEKTIDEFVFLITDDDELEAGYGSGQIYEIRLMWNPSITITIVTIALIMIIIPIIIMIVPTLTLYSRYGKSVIMPVFIFMSIICFAGGLIPAWLFFILMIGAGGFLVLKKGSDT